MSLDPGHFWKLVFAVYGLASLAAFVLYGLDKRAAANERRRIPERVLHLVELAGGWPGAIVGMAVFSHKRRKASYLAVFVVIVLLHVLLWMWLLGVFA